MFIERNGIKIELTEEEIREACWEYDKQKRIEDLVEELELYVAE